MNIGAWRLSWWLILVGFAVGFVIGWEPIWAGQSIWTGHTFFFFYHKWVGPVFLTLLSVTWVTWRSVKSDRREGCLVRRDAMASFAMGEVAGGGIGLVVTLEWLLHLVVPPAPGQVGYLPQWPWEAVASPLSTRLLPAATFLFLWVAIVSIVVRLDALKRPIIKDPSGHPADSQG